MIALSVLNLEKTVTSLLAGVGIIGLALGFAFQDLAANLMSGFMIAANEPLASGDLIENSGHLGFVESVTLRFTMLRTFQGQLVRIPNRMIFENPLVNYTKTGERRVDVEVGVAYGEDLDEVERVAVQAVETIEERNTRKPVDFYYRQFGSSSIDFSIRFWIDVDKHDYFGAHSAAIRRIKKAFDDNDITIPFPIRTLDFSEVGGNVSPSVEKLLGRPGSDSSRDA
jgi:small conductance mechanosensitive channel